MNTPVRNWIARRIALGGFSSRRDVVLFALSRTFWTTIAAVALNFVIYQLFGRLGLFNVTIPPDAWSDTVVTAFVAGPISFLAYSFVGAAILDLAISRNEFERLSRIDPLTGLLNRRAFVEAVAGLRGRYVLAVFDIDRFKMINDNHGHNTGDQILVAVAELFQNLDGADAVARLGGEEFAAVLTNVDKANAIERIDSLRQQLAARTFEFGEGEISVTVSAGISHGDNQNGYSSLLNQADKALYLAKAAGRNRVVHADDMTGLFPANESFLNRRAI